MPDDTQVDTRVEVVLTDGPLGDTPTQWLPCNAGAGALMRFDGVVRPTEDDRPLQGLRYEQYEPMTRRMLHDLGRAMVEQYQLTALRVEHSTGHVPNHAVSFRLTLAAPHRKEALAAVDTFIDRMKRDIPLWKVPVWADNEP